MTSRVRSWGPAAGIGLCIAALSRAAAPYCPIVDGLHGTASHAEAGLVSRQRVRGERQGSFGLLEQRAHAEFVYLHTPVGPVSLTGLLNNWVTTGGELAGIPSHFGEAAVRVRADVRSWRGLTFRADASPGMYSDFRRFGGDAFGVPFAASLIQTLDPTLSVQAGLRVFPGFRRVYDPLAGLRWTPGSVLTVDLFYPESSLAWRWNADWSFVADLSWRQVRDFDLRAGDGRERFHWTESRASAGVDRRLGNSLVLTLRAGAVFDRRVGFKRSAGPGQDVDTGFFGAIGVGAEF